MELGRTTGDGGEEEECELVDEVRGRGRLGRLRRRVERSNPRTWLVRKKVCNYFHNVS